MKQRKNVSYVDADDYGVFLRLAHATSSGLVPEIKQFGLRPLYDVRSSIVSYCRQIAPELTPLQISDMLDDVKSKASPNAVEVLLRIRPDHNDSLYLLPVSGSDEILKSAAENARADGGEIFRAARRVLEQRLGRPLKPRFEGEDAVIVVAKIRLRKIGNELHLPQSSDFDPLKLPYRGEGSWSANSAEVRITSALSPSVLQFVPEEKFFSTSRVFVSDRAADKFSERI